MRKDLALKAMNKAHDYAKRLIAGIDESMWLVIPDGNYSSIAWQYGHIAASDYRLCLLRVRGNNSADVSFVPQGFIELFAKGSTPSELKNYSPTQIKTIFDSISQKILKEAESWSDEYLLENSEGAAHPMFSQRIEALEYSSSHAFIHCGQIGILRRQLGFSSLG